MICCLKDGLKPWLDGRANADNVDLNRNFPEVDKLEYKYEKMENGLNNHIMSLNKALSGLVRIKHNVSSVHVIPHKLPMTLKYK
jgi:hypothetical protein